MQTGSPLGEESTPGRDSFETIFNELIELYPSTLPLHFKPDYAAVCHIAHGWYMRVHRGCLAVLRLGDAGFAIEAWPIRRSVLEHVVAMRWLAAEGGRVKDVVVRQLANQASSRKDAIVRAGWATPDLAAFDAAIADGLVAQEAREQDTYLLFKHRCDKYGDPSDWSSWLIESAHSHPGWETAAPYLEAGTPTVLLTEPKPEDRDDVGWATMKLWEALSAVSGMSHEPAWTDELAATRGRIDALVASWFAAWSAENR